MFTQILLSISLKQPKSVLESLVEQSRSNGMEVDTVIGDTAYSGIENLRLAEGEKNGFELISKLHPVIRADGVFCIK